MGVPQSSNIWDWAHEFRNGFLHQPGVTAPVRGPRVMGGSGRYPVLPMKKQKLRGDGARAKHRIPDSSLGVLFSCPHRLLYELYCGDGDTFKWKFLGELPVLAS